MSNYIIIDRIKEGNNLISIQKLLNYIWTCKKGSEFYGIKFKIFYIMWKTIIKHR